VRKAGMDERYIRAYKKTGSMLNKALSWGLIKVNPMREVKMFKYEERDVTILSPGKKRLLF